MVMLIGRIYNFGEQPLPAHLRTMGKALEERAALSNDLHVQEIGVFLRLLANTLEDADVSGDDDERDELPEGVVAVPMGDPSVLHDTLRDILGS